MSARENILERIRKNTAPEKAYPEYGSFEVSGDLVESFRNSLLAQGGALVEQYPVQEIMSSLFPEAKRWLDLTTGYKQPQFPLEELQVAIFTAALGVAENGAVWIAEPAMGRRELPVIAEHVVFYLRKERIMGTMHQAYHEIDNLSGYGLFVSGPSKTADIEQALVIGAHGPKSHTVVLI